MTDDPVLAMTIDDALCLHEHALTLSSLSASTHYTRRSPISIRLRSISGPPPFGLQKLLLHLIMTTKMVRRQELDYVLVPLGLLIMVLYHVWLLYRVLKYPTTTVMGINAISRRIWTRTMMADSAKNGVLAVQTLRNNIMASTLLASMAITLSSLIAVLMTSSVFSHSSQGREDIVLGNTGDLLWSVKFFSILVCFLLAFLLNLQSIRYYSHASMLINVPVGGNRVVPALAAEYVARALNWGSYFWSLGLRAFYFSFPLFLWVFGPIPMISSCMVLVFMLYFLDVYWGWGEGEGEGEEGGEERKGEEETANRVGMHQVSINPYPDA